LTLCTLLYAMVTTGVGMVTSTFTKTQVAAVFSIVAIINQLTLLTIAPPGSQLQCGRATWRGNATRPTFFGMIRRDADHRCRRGARRAHVRRSSTGLVARPRAFVSGALARSAS
jgi:hypothetical protein